MSGFKPKIGALGTGWIGETYAKEFEKRDFEVTRYSLDPKYAKNKPKINECDMVFVAVPTPTTPEGFNFETLQDVLALVGKGKIAIIKSTVLPGTTDKLQEKYPDIKIMHSPEFLTEATAEFDVAHPNRNIIGCRKQDEPEALFVMSFLPDAPTELITTPKTAELIKYGGNCWFYFKVIWMNLLADAANKLDVDFAILKNAMAADDRIGSTHLDYEHQGGRGAGGHCFIKDMAAFHRKYMELCPDDRTGDELLRLMEAKNLELLIGSDKDIDLVKGVYGENIC